MPLVQAAVLVSLIFILMGCASLLDTAEGRIDSAEVYSDKVGALALDYVCNRMRIRVLRDLIATSPGRLAGWSAMCPMPTGDVGAAVSTRPE